MQKIIDYVVLEDFPTHCLTKKVLEHMAKGWQPLGGVSSAYNGNTIKYQQAMVRYQS